MNLKNVFLLFVAFSFIGLLGCTNEPRTDIPNSESEKGSTYMNFSLRLNSSSLRAEDENFNSIGDWPGVDVIKEVALYIIDKGVDKAPTVNPIIVKVAPDYGKDGVYQPIEPIKTTPGKKMLYVVVNNSTTTSDLATKLNIVSEEYEKFKKFYENLNNVTLPNYYNEFWRIQDMIDNNGLVNSAYAKYDESTQKDEIVMSGDPVELDAQPNVSADEAKDPSNPNFVNLNVRRIASRVKTTINQSLLEEDGSIYIEYNSPESFIKLTDLKWAPAQYERYSLLYPGKGQVDAKTTKSTAYSFIPIQDGTGEDNEYANAINYYVYDKLESPIAISGFTRTGSHQGDVEAIVKDKSDLLFITETTHPYGDAISKKGNGYRKGNTPYVLLSATIYYGTQQGDVESYDPINGKSEEELNNDTSTRIGGMPQSSNVKPLISVDDETYSDLYYGLADGKFYLYYDLKNAREANKSAATNGGDGLVRFRNGKCYFILWINPDVINPEMWEVSPVLRNNIYHINISAIKRLGFSGNPLYPGEGNPTPPDPDEFPYLPKPEDPLKDLKTNIFAEVTAINWGAHSYDIEIN